MRRLAALAGHLSSPPAAHRFVAFLSSSAAEGTVAAKGDGVIGLDHVQLAMPVGKEEKAVEFYEGVLGLRRIPKPPHLEKRGGVWFEISPMIQLHLGVEQPFAPARKAHPAFIVTDIAAIKARLIAAGAPIKRDELDPPTSQRFFSEDCFANRLEFVPVSPSESASIS